MTLAASWLLFPLVMGIVCLGCGLLLDAFSGFRLPRPLLLPAGLALVVVLAQLAIFTSVPTPLALPAVLVAALAGFALPRPWNLGPRPSGRGLAAPVGSLAVFAAP